MLVNELLTEARKKNLTYTANEVKGKVEKVTVVLDGKESAKFTKLAAEFKKLDAAFDKAKNDLEANKTSLKGLMEDYFDAEDEVLTRVMETCSITLQLSKAVKPGITVDYENAYNSVITQLMGMVPDLKTQIEKLSAEAIKAASKPNNGKKASLSVKEGVIDSVMNVFKKLVEQLKSWGAKYDKKLDKVKTDMGSIGKIGPGTGRQALADKLAKGKTTF
jgi:septation ring formation regulator EzrA